MGKIKLGCRNQNETILCYAVYGGAFYAGENLSFGG